VVFLHIPRTGGQTLYAVLARQYPYSRTIAITGPLAPSIPLPEDANSIRPVLIRGHMPYGVHQQLEIEPLYITVLRNPIDRVISTYRFARRFPDHPLHRQLHESRMSLVDFVRSDISSHEVNNAQTRQLAGDVSGVPDRLTLDRAKANLRSFAAFGLTERFDETLVFFRRRLRWRIPVYVSKNVVGDPGHVDSWTWNTIEERNVLDIELFGFASALFDEFVRTEPLFKAEVAAFRAVNAAAQGYRRIRGGQRFPSASGLSRR
jgi:hypothetical protein